MKKQHYAIMGRFNGDDESLVFVFEADDYDDAVRRFKEEMCDVQDLKPGERAEALGDNPSEYLEICVEAVLRSDARIEQV